MTGASLAREGEAEPTACFNCCDMGGGYYKPYDGETVWHIGLDQSGQGHYACAECAPLLFNVKPLRPALSMDCMRGDA